jgi:hypothetical protein
MESLGFLGFVRGVSGVSGKTWQDQLGATPTVVQRRAQQVAQAMGLGYIFFMEKFPRNPFLQLNRFSQHPR